MGNMVENLPWYEWKVWSVGVHQPVGYGHLDSAFDSEEDIILEMVYFYLMRGNKTVAQICQKVAD